MGPKLAIWGAGGHAMVVADIVRLQAEYELAGFLDDISPERQGNPFFGSTILGGREQLEYLHDLDIHTLIMGFGHCQARLRLAALARAQGYRLATAIHPKAIIAADVPVGSGTVIKAGAVVDPGVSIGGQVIIGSTTFIGHGSMLEDGVRISAGVSLGGNVAVGRATWVGIGATVKDRVRIGAGCLIGAGAVVVQDIPDRMVAYGVPARVVREITTEDY